MNLQEFRAQFAVTQKYTYLNHSGMSPLATRTAQAMQAVIEQQQMGDAEVDFTAMTSGLKDSIRKLIKARSTEEIALTQSTSHGLNLVAHSLPLQSGDNVVFSDMEYPSNAYPWMNLQPKGIESRLVPHRNGGLHLADLVEYVDARTRVVAASSVEFLTGFKNHLEAIGKFCRARGITFVVDGIQSLGSIPMDVEANYIDVLATSGYKLLMGPSGIGFLYVRKELLDSMQPIFAGSHSVVDHSNYLPYHLDFLPDAGKFEANGAGIVTAVGLKTAIDLLLEVGIENIERQTMQLGDQMVAELQKFSDVRILTCLEPHHRSAIVAFTTPDPQQTHQTLLANKIRCALRGDHQHIQYIRISPHGYNIDADIQRVAAVLRTMWN